MTDIKLNELINVEISENIDVCNSFIESLYKNNIISISNETDYKKHMSLAQGIPGTILLLTELNNIDHSVRWDKIIHEYIKGIIKNIEINGVNDLSLFTGLTGINYSVLFASDNARRYNNLISKLDMILLNGINGYIDHIIDYKKKNQILGCTEIELDIISGFSGMGLYLLESYLINKNENTYKVLIRIIKYFINVSEDMIYNGKVLPGWFIPPSETIIKKDMFKKGYFNCGLSHGISGPLAFLSIAHLNGVNLKGLVETIDKITSWIIKKQQSSIGNTWPFFVSFEDEINNKIRIGKSKHAWCYGLPGVARSIFLAGKSLDCENYMKVGVDAFESLVKESMVEWNINSPMLCHGFSGVYQIIKRMYDDTGEPTFLRQKDQIINLIIKEFDFTEYKNSVNLFANKSIYNYERLGWLEGLTGIILVLLTKNSKKSIWDRALGII